MIEIHLIATYPQAGLTLGIVLAEAVALYVGYSVLTALLARFVEQAIGAE